MTQTYLYIGGAFLLGFAVSLAICILQWMKIRKNQKSLEGFLESEKLIKERFQKENKWLHDVKENAQNDYEVRIQQLQAVIKTMDEDILLLQKHNEETESLLNATDPVVHSLKLRLLEANNTIARYKSKVPVK